MAAFGSGNVVFNFPAPAETTRAQVASFVLAMDSDLAPVVGQQVSWRPNAPATAEAQMALLKQQARQQSPRPVCDLVVRASVDGVATSALYQADGNWLLRKGSTLTDTALRQLATVAQPLTFTCVAPGNGRRIALNQL